MNARNIDSLIGEGDKILRIFTGVSSGVRPNPSNAIAEGLLDGAEKGHSAGLMRVNHVGEVCAQALYQAQGRFSNNPALKQQFADAGREEEDHLAWTAQRLREFGSRPSLLNPFWYVGAYALGAIAARCGDGISLGFVVETERQVTAHLEQHLQTLPEKDAKSRTIVEKMRDDEAAHAATATSMGASKLPAPVQGAMRAMAKIMTSTAYYL